MAVIGRDLLYAARFGVVRVRVRPRGAEGSLSAADLGAVWGRKNGARSGVIVSSSSGKVVKRPSEIGGSDKSPVSVSVSAAEPGMLADGKGHMGVEGGYMGVIGTLASSGSTKAFQGPWKGLPSTYNVCKENKRQSQLGSEFILFRRMLRVCSLSSSLKVSGRVLIPVESAIRTRRDVRWERKTGRTRRGLDARFSSSRHVHEARAGGTATRKLADMSRARRVLQICGRVFARKKGIAFGVLDEPTSRCVVPGRNPS